jgi:hypothetical protein
MAEAAQKAQPSDLVLGCAKGIDGIKEGSTGDHNARRVLGHRGLGQRYADLLGSPLYPSTQVDDVMMGDGDEPRSKVILVLLTAEATETPMHGEPDV